MCTNEIHTKSADRLHIRPALFYFWGDPVTTEDIKRWVEADEVWRFYSSGEWKSLRNEVLREQKGECQDCREKKGLFDEATMVHHEQELRNRPDLALVKFYLDEQGVTHRQLTSLCDDCHEIRHPERFKQAQKKIEPWPERWD